MFFFVSLVCAIPASDFHRVLSLITNNCLIVEDVQVLACASEALGIRKRLGARAPGGEATPKQP